MTEDSSISGRTDRFLPRKGKLRAVWCVIATVLQSLGTELAVCRLAGLNAKLFRRDYEKINLEHIWFVSSDTT